MSDRLREALDNLDKHGVYTGVKDSYAAVVAAARRWLALTETGQRVEWCEEHDQAAKTCPFYKYETLERLHTPCRIVPKLLADYLTEEEA